MWHRCVQYIPNNYPNNENAVCCWDWGGESRCKFIFQLLFKKTIPWNKTSFRRVLPSCSVSAFSQSQYSRLPFKDGKLEKFWGVEISQGFLTYSSLLAFGYSSRPFWFLLVKTDSSRQRACDSGQMHVLCMLPLKNGWVEWTTENTEEPEKVGMMNQSWGKFPTGSQ